MARYRGKHRKPSSTRHAIARFTAMGAVIATPIVMAHAAGAADWDALAQCESGGNWAANTGNGFSGGLQFTSSTWAAYGGTQYADNAADATREQQIEIAQRVLAAQGPGAWPVCSKKTGFVGNGSGDTSAGNNSNASPGGTSSGSNSNGDDASSGNGSSAGNDDTGPGDTTRSGETPGQGTGNQPAPTTDGDYTVRSGDTLSGIGDQFGVSWYTIYQRNATTVHDPNRIFPGEQLALR